MKGILIYLAIFFWLSVGSLFAGYIAYRLSNMGTNKEVETGWILINAWIISCGLGTALMCMLM